MQVTALSGTTVAQLDEEQLHCMVESGKAVRDLKQLLSAEVGCSRFRQRLFSDGIGELPDDMPLRSLPSIQLVVLPFCAFDEAAEEELRRNCKDNNAMAIERLLQAPQEPNGGGLFLAVEEGHLEAVRLLLEAGADKDAARIDGVTAVFVAAQNGHLEVVRLLLEAGANKDVVRRHGATALFIAAQNGHLKVVRLLLEAGADKDAATTDGTTALQIASQNGHMEVQELLLPGGF
ncbi:unnamed protein product [Durusdinium trenchii]|uniref:Uncharacterized protein n=1 Tax=Durusdinium trenchii TaxID=1381693 RepID=A0ABP0L386_9DINO